MRRSPPSRATAFSNGVAAHARDRASVIITFAGSLSVPRSFCGARNGAVGLDEQPVERHRGGRLPQVLVLRIRHVAREAHEVAARRALPRDVRRRRRSSGSPRAPPNPHRALEGRPATRRGRGRRAACRTRSTTRCGPEAPDPGRRPGSACGSSRARTPPRRSPGGPRASPRARRRRSVVEGRRVVGMHARRGEDTLERIGELERSAARFGVDAHADQPVDAGGPRGLHHIWRFAVEQEQVAVGVDGPGCTASSGFWSLIGRRRYAGLHMRSIGGASRET